MSNDLINPSLKTAALIKSIYDSQFPEKIIKTLPAQTVYFALKQQGLLNSADLIEMSSIDQVRIMIDLDCWNKDQFSEEVFWDWLALTDANDDLEILHKIIQAVDLKLVALVISKYTEIVQFDDPTENPPRAEFYTPDKGYTWLFINPENPERHFLIGRLLALIFETNPELFYQLTSIPTVSTDSILEEESYQDRNRRLSAEGIPDPEYAAEFNQSATFAELIKSIEPTATAVKKRKEVEYAPIITPIVTEGDYLSDLNSLQKQVKDFEEFEGELTLLTNSAIVHWNVVVDDFEELLFTINKVKGILNIGIETCLGSSQAKQYNGVLEIYELIGLKGFYKIGLSQLYSLRNSARKKPLQQLLNSETEKLTSSLIIGLSQYIPVVPKWYEDGDLLQLGAVSSESRESVDNAKDIERLRSGYSAISSMQLLSRIQETLDKMNN